MGRLILNKSSLARARCEQIEESKVPTLVAGVRSKLIPPLAPDKRVNHARVSTAMCVRRYRWIFHATSLLPLARVHDDDRGPRDRSSTANNSESERKRERERERERKRGTETGCTPWRATERQTAKKLDQP